MAATKKLISDQVLYKLAGGTPDAAFPIDERDIFKATEQKINSLFKLTQFNQTLPSGQTIPDNLMIATYQNIDVVPYYSGKTKSTLPIVPVSLPLNAGVNEIRPVISTVGNETILGDPMIPLLEGQDFLLNADDLLSDLLGQISYQPNGKTIVYNKDLSTIGVSKVWMKLVVFDMSQYGANDVLPIPADMEQQIVDELVQSFSPVTAESGQVNVWTTAGQNLIKQ